MKLMPLFRSSSRIALCYITLVVLLPLLSLVILGLVYLQQNSLLLLVTGAWLLVTLLGYTAFFIWPQRQTPLNPHRPSKATESSIADRESLPEKLPKKLNENQNWTEQDRLIWLKMCSHVESRLDEQMSWQSLVDESLQLLSTVSAHYNPEKTAIEDSKNHRLQYHFTLPEALLVLSIASERYRKIVLQHIPFAEQVTIASLLSLYDKQHSVKTGYLWFNRIRRVLRLSNPAAAALAELRDQLTNRVFEHLSSNVQHDMKRLLLQEVVHVGIDLYSGKLKASDHELEGYRSRAYQQDLNNPPPAAEPLRIVLVGQSSAGKSSLINALVNTLEAEIDILPSTDSTVTHCLQLDNANPMHLIDTAGLNQNALASDSHRLLAEQADLLLIVARANQPARAPEQQWWQSLQASFRNMPQRRAPPLMLVLTHIDQLSPKGQWSPPYDLHSSERKAINIKGSLESTIRQIELPVDTPSVPICLSSEKGIYNVEAVAAQLMMLQSHATLTQLNRRRLERGDKHSEWKERWQQLKQLSQVLGRAAIGNKADSEH